MPAFTARFGEQRVMNPGIVTGSKDVGVLATAAGAPCMFWLLGGYRPGDLRGRECGRHDGPRHPVESLTSVRAADPADTGHRHGRAGHRREDVDADAVNPRQ